jgi:hypothetical protein
MAPWGFRVPLTVAVLMMGLTLANAHDTFCDNSGATMLDFHQLPIHEWPEKLRSGATRCQMAMLAIVSFCENQDCYALERRRRNLARIMHGGWRA